MSIDRYYKSYDPGNPPVTYDFLVEAVKGKCEIVTVEKNDVGVVTGFALVPNDASLKNPNGLPYEFFLQDDGRYWYAVSSRDDTGLEIESQALSEIESLLRWDEDYELGF